MSQKKGETSATKDLNCTRASFQTPIRDRAHVADHNADGP
jgi:hypothetical protein